MNKKTIWSNIGLDTEDFEDYFQEQFEEELDEDEKMMEMYDLNDMYLEDARMNLSQELEGEILVLADLGLWDGRKQGHKIIGSTNLAKILYSNMDYAEWYVEDGELQGRQIHHDGTNYLTYRVIREGRDIERLLDMMVEGKEISKQRLSAYTRSLAPVVNDIFGW